MYLERKLNDKINSQDFSEKYQNNQILQKDNNDFSKDNKSKFEKIFNNYFINQ